MDSCSQAEMTRSGSCGGPAGSDGRVVQRLLHWNGLFFSARATDFVRLCPRGEALQLRQARGTELRSSGRVTVMMGSSVPDQAAPASDLHRIERIFRAALSLSLSPAW